MTHADLTAAQWRELSDEAAARVARMIGRENQLELVDVHSHAYAGRHQRIALFEREGMRFSLVPSDRVRLGYDGAGFVASAQQAASYADSAAEYGLPEITAFVDTMTSPDRVVELPAMLVAVEALDPCATTLPPDDPRVRELVAESVVRPGGGISHDEALRRAAALGLRPTTPDEWEYACGAGARTLFRWGDDSPGEGYPYDHPTGLHRELNLWGLAIGQDPYRHEWTTEPTVVCGGDGGGATCGGSGFFLGWLTLATAFRDKDFGAWLSSDDGYVDELLIRPVVDMI